MPIPINKNELLLAIEDTYLKLKNDLNSIPPNCVRNNTLAGHVKATKIHVCDLLAYLIGWGELVIKWVHKDANNEPIDFPETGYQWNQLGQLAQKFYTDYQSLNYKDLLKKLESTVNRILLIVKMADNEQLYEQLWYKQWTMGRMIQLNTASPYKNARARLRKWKREQGI